MCFRFLIAVLFFLPQWVAAQSGFTKEELLKALEQKQADSTLVDIYNELSWPIYSYDQPDSAEYYGQLAIGLAAKINDIKRLSIAHRRIGIAYINNDQFKKAIFHQQESYALSEKINFQEGKLKALNNLGVIYLNNELLNKALTYFLKSLIIVQKTTDPAVISNIYNNCGLIYNKTSDYKSAQRSFIKAIFFAKEAKNTDLQIILNCSLSSLFQNLNKADSAKFFLDEAEQMLDSKSNVRARRAYCLAKGLYFSYTKKHQLSLESFLDCRNDASMSANEKITLLFNIAEQYKKVNQTAKAIQYFEEAYALSLESKTYNNLMYLSHELAELYESQGNIKKFTQLIKLHLSYRDSNEKFIKIQQIRQQQLEFDYELKQVADSLKFVQKEQLKDIELQVVEAKLNKEKSFKVILLLFLVLLIIFSVFIYNRFFVIRNQNKIIEQQKQTVELKNHEILDSINYAKRLQSAILPQKENIREFLNFDIFYLPKDIIGGDFYFFETHYDHLIIAVCDCTGHGIPGAIMSVVCHQALRKSIKEFDLLVPALILNKTRELIIEQLNATNQNIKDGMDCSLMTIDRRRKRIKWAGANNPLWVLQNEELLEVKADKQPVALYENAKEFSTYEMALVPGTTFYLFSDGYADQFGGERGKKFKQKQLKECLVAIKHLSPQEQTKLLEEKYLSWKGDLDQVDDVAVAVISV